METLIFLQTATHTGCYLLLFLKKNEIRPLRIIFLIIRPGVKKLITFNDGVSTMIFIK